jgi:lipopolysaccharide/colanic/teichoic acid biosynthesis glycosyltransferase
MIGAHNEPKVPGLTISVAGVAICLCLLFLLDLEPLGSGNPWWRYALYLIPSVFLPIFLYRVLAYRSQGATFERDARLAFLLSVTLGISLGLYRAFAFAGPVDFLALTLTVTGCFAGMLAVTWQATGLVELNSPPSASVRDTVMEKHRLLLDTRSARSLIKRAFDISLSLIGLVLSSPLWVVASLAIWLEDPGPLLFAKVCVTRGGEGFTQFKFRSMVKEAEKKSGPVLAADTDPRITRIGKLMRKTAMDELPQILNILKGTMSFVGPRPQRTVLVHRYLEEMPQYALRHAQRPGLTGLAQVYGSYYVSPRQKLRYDLIYVRKQSLCLDLKLILLSFWISFRGKWVSIGKKV